MPLGLPTYLPDAALGIGFFRAGEVANNSRSVTFFYLQKDCTDKAGPV
jgi:hypothetical protein